MKFLLLIFLVVTVSKSQDSISGVNLFLVTKDNETVKLDWDNFRFDNSKKSMIFIYGWNNNLTSDCTIAIKNAFLRKNEFQILLLDWSNYSSQRYLRAINDVDKIGSFVAQKLSKLMKSGLNMEKWYFVGYSLGAHLAGSIGRNLKSSDNFTISRITGLDPAGPAFFPISVSEPLCSKDAKFVDIIHTNSKQAGTLLKSGHVDFWPSGGQYQKGCDRFLVFNVFSYVRDSCNHHRAWMYYVESVGYEEGDKKFWSVYCGNYRLFIQKMCKGTPIYNYMGFHANAKNEGNFFLETNDKSPFSL